MTTTAKRAVAYTRVSTEGQSGERHVSLPTQEAHIEDYARRLNLQIIGTYTDVASGRRDTREQYQAMLSYVRGGNVDVIVCQFLDRFGRNPREILSRIWQLQEAGVAVEVTDEDIREELMLMVRVGLAGAESRRNGERVKAALAMAHEQGRFGGTPPYGLRKVREVDGSYHIEVDEAEAAHIRHAVEIVLTHNLGYKALGERMHAEGFRGRTGKVWGAQDWRRVLRSPSLRGGQLVGVKRGDVTEIPNVYPPILDDVTAAALAQRLDIRSTARGRTHTSPFLLSGLARCGYCNGPLTGHSRERHGSTHRSYRCANNTRNKALCRFHNSHNAAKLESTVLHYLGQYQDPERVRELLAATDTKKRSDATKRLSTINKELARLDTDLRKDLDLLHRGLLDERDFQVGNEGRRERRVTLEGEREQLIQEADRQQATDYAIEAIPTMISSFSGLVNSADVRQAKAQLQLILKAVHVKRDDVEIEFRT